MYSLCPIWVALANCKPFYWDLAQIFACNTFDFSTFSWRAKANSIYRSWHQAHTITSITAPSPHYRPEHTQLDRFPFTLKCATYTFKGEGGSVAVSTNELAMMQEYFCSAHSTCVHQLSCLFAVSIAAALCCTASSSAISGRIGHSAVVSHIERCFDVSMFRSHSIRLRLPLECDCFNVTRLSSRTPAINIVHCTFLFVSCCFWMSPLNLLVTCVRILSQFECNQ